MTNEIPEPIALVLLQALTQYPNFWPNNMENWEAAWSWVEQKRGNVEEMGG